MQSNEIRFAVSPAPGGKRLVGIFDGIFENDDQIAAYMREQAQVLQNYADGINEYTRKHNGEGRTIGVGNGV